MDEIIVLINEKRQELGKEPYTYNTILAMDWTTNPHRKKICLDRFFYDAGSLITSLWVIKDTASLVLFKFKNSACTSNSN